MRTYETNDPGDGSSNSETTKHNRNFISKNLQICKSSFAISITDVYYQVHGTSAVGQASQ